LRSVPTVSKSNKRIHIGGITKRGRKLSYELILQGIEHTIKYSLPLNKFFEEKIKGKRRVIVRAAIVRKVIESVYYILRYKTAYRFYNERNYKNKLKVLQKYRSFSCAA
jgi:hypothetical protein